MSKKSILALTLILTASLILGYFLTRQQPVNYFDLSNEDNIYILQRSGYSYSLSDQAKTMEIPVAETHIELDTFTDQPVHILGKFTITNKLQCQKQFEDECTPKSNQSTFNAVLIDYIEIAN